MGAQAGVACAAGAIALAQLIKFVFRPPDRAGALIVSLVSASLVGVWAYDKGIPVQGNLWDLLMSWIIVTGTSAGVFGFSRTATGAITDFKARREGEA